MASPAGLGNLVELLDPLFVLTGDGRVAVQHEVAGVPFQDQRLLGFLLVSLAVGTRQLRQLFPDVLDQFIDGDQAIRLIADIVGLALEAVGHHGRENAVLLQVERRLEAGVGHKDDPALRRADLVVLAHQLAIKLCQVGISDFLVCRP